MTGPLSDKQLAAIRYVLSLRRALLPHEGDALLAQIDRLTGELADREAQIARIDARCLLAVRTSHDRPAPPTHDRSQNPPLR